MKKYYSSVLIIIGLLFNFSVHGFAVQNTDYEKYGKIAMAAVQSDFPGDPIRDYEYLGRRKIDDTKVEDAFRFKVQENNQKYLVIVRVTHDVTNKKLLNLTVESQKQ